MKINQRKFIHLDLVKNLSHSPEFLGARASHLASLEKIGLNVPTSLAIKPIQVQSWLNEIQEFKAEINYCQLWNKDNLNEKLETICSTINSSPKPQYWHVTANRIRQLRSKPNSKLIFHSNPNVINQNDVQFDDLCYSYIPHGYNDDELWETFKKIICTSYKKQFVENLYLSGLSPLDFSPGVIIQPLIKAKIQGQIIYSDSQNPFHNEAALTQNNNKKYFAKTLWSRVLSENELANIKHYNSSSLMINADEDLPPLELDRFWDKLRNTAIDACHIFNQQHQIDWVWDGDQFWVQQIKLSGSTLSYIAAQTPEHHHWTREKLPSHYKTAMSLSTADSLLTQAKFSATYASNASILALKGDPMIHHQGLLYRNNQLIETMKSPYSCSWKNIYKLTSSLPKKMAQSKAKINQQLSGLLNFDKDAKNHNQDNVDQSSFNLAAQTLIPQTELIISHWRYDKKLGLSQLKSFNQGLKLQLEKMDAKRNAPQSLIKLTSITNEFHKTEIALEVCHSQINNILQSIYNTFENSLKISTTEIASLFQLATDDSDKTHFSLQQGLKSISKAVSEDSHAFDFIDKLSQAKNLDESIQASKVLNLEASIEWQQFILTHQHVSDKVELSMPSWGECPSQLAPILNNKIATLNSENSSPSINSIDKSDFDEVQKSMIDFFFSHNEEKMAQIIGHLFKLKEIIMDIQKDMNYLSAKFSHPMKVLYSISGQYLTELNQLSHPQDCFHLTVDEILKSMKGRGIKWQDLIEQRKELFAKSTRQINSAKNQSRKQLRIQPRDLTVAPDQLSETTVKKTSATPQPTATTHELQTELNSLNSELTPNNSTNLNEVNH
jgi:hypothetical protein